MTLLLLYVGFALGVSFLCSLLEAALLSSRIAALEGRRERGSRGAARLLDLKRHRIDDAISAILTINTVANTLGATLAGAQAAKVYGSARVGIFSGVLTLLILIFSEIIPKTVGAIYATVLAGFVGHTLHGLTRVMSPFLVLSRVITGLFTSNRPAGSSRSELAAVVATASQDGAISSSEARIFENVLRFDDVKIEDVMTPRTVTVMLPAETTLEQLLARKDAEVFSRIPVFEGPQDNVVGYVLQREVLLALARGCERNLPLQAFLRPIQFLPEKTSFGTALVRILKHREPIAMVADEHGGIEGLVTLEDLTETVLGVEIMDELDRYADLRQTALRLREERLERLRRRKETPP